MNKKTVIILSFIFCSVFLNALIAFFIFNLTSADNFDKTPLIIQRNIANSEKEIVISDIGNYEEMSSAQQEYLMKTLITQYITDRYTFIPDQNYMDAKTGKWIKNNKIESLTLSKYSVNHNASINYKTGRYNQVWYEFIDEKRGDVKDFERMLKNNITQKVEIKEIYKEDDFWIVKIRLFKKELGKPVIYEDKTIQLQTKIHGLSNQEGVIEKPEYYYLFEVYFLKSL